MHALFDAVAMRCRRAAAPRCRVQVDMEGAHRRHLYLARDPRDQVISSMHYANNFRAAQKATKEQLSLVSTPLWSFCLELCLTGLAVFCTHYTLSI